MDQMVEHPSATGEVKAADSPQPRRSASRSRAGPTTRGAAETTGRRVQNGAVARDADQTKGTPTSIVARAEAVVTKSAEITKSVALAGACAIGLMLLLQNYEPARDALQELFELAPHIKQLTAGTLVVAFDESTVGSAVKVELDKDSPHAKDPTYIGRLTEIIQSLKPDHYKRLMYVDQLRNLCQYERQSVDVDYDFSLDRELEERGLVTLRDSPTLLKEISEKLEFLGGMDKPQLGHPRFCYTMSLTSEGYDAKTAFVKTMIKYVRTAPR
jgi:hypothetical protein